jgi:hypothetical protein
MVLYTYVCVHAFLLRREFPDRILGDKLLLFQGGSVTPYLSYHPQKSHTLCVIGSEAGESFLVLDHVSRATGIHEPRVLQTTVHHLYRMRKGRWLNARVSEKNFRNPTLNHTIRRGFHSPLHLII